MSNVHEAKKLSKQKKEKWFQVGDKLERRDDWPEDLDPSILGEMRLGHVKLGVKPVKKKEAKK